MSPTRRFVVPQELAAVRLDRALAVLNPEWTRSQAHRLIDRGRVTVDGRTAKPSTSVAAGVEIIVDEPEVVPSSAEAEALDLVIVYEDAHILVINKAAGMVVHPAAGNPSGTLVNALLHHCDDLSGIGGVERPGIVHRLDKDTSGLMVVAKNDSAHRRLSLAFRRREVHKTYLAVCYGDPESEGVVDAPVGRHPHERKRMAITRSGRPARTTYTVEERFTGAALLACSPITGRTHQIRVHMAHAGHAIVGDPLYSGRQWRNLEEPARSACRNFPRQALHAHRLELTHPATGETVTFEAALPEDMAVLLETLREAPAPPTH